MCIVKGKPGLHLAAGGHRIEACKLLGWMHIPAKIVEVEDELEIEFIMHAEDLKRNDRSMLDRCVGQHQMKQIYDQKNPDVMTHGGDRRAKRNNCALIPSYSQHAVSDPKNRRSIQEEIRIGRTILPYAEKPRGIPIENSKSDLSALSRLPEEDIEAMVNLIRLEKFQTVAEATFFQPRVQRELLRGFSAEEYGMNPTAQVPVESSPSPAKNLELASPLIEPPQPHTEEQRKVSPVRTSNPSKGKNMPQALPEYLRGHEEETEKFVNEFVLNYERRVLFLNWNQKRGFKGITEFLVHLFDARMQKDGAELEYVHSR